MSEITYGLGRSIAQLVPFHRVPIKKQQLKQDLQPKQPKKDKEIITNKLVITMVIIAIVKVAVLMLWI